MLGGKGTGAVKVEAKLWMLKKKGFLFVHFLWGLALDEKKMIISGFMMWQRKESRCFSR